MGTNRSQNTRGYTHQALFPQIMVNLTWCILEVFFLSLAILLTAKKIHIITQKFWGTLIIILFFFIFEIIRRLTLLSANTYHLYIKIFLSVKKQAYKASKFFKTRRSLLLAYIISNFVFLMLIAPKAFEGLKTPLIPLEDRYAGLMSNAINLSTVTLVIFFAIIVAIIQYVSKDFSGVFLKIVITDAIFISGVLLILLLNFSFLSILRFGSNEYLLSATFYAICYIIVIFILLLGLTIYYLSIPNIIQKTIGKTKRFIKNKVPKAPPPQNGTVLLARITRKQKIQSWIARWIVGSIKLKQLFELGVAKREVDRDVIDEIENKLRPIGSAILTAIEKDRDEVVSACLNGFETTVRTYIEARKNYIGEIDQFNLFVLSLYEAALKSAIKSPNQQYTEEITHSAARIGESTLVLKTITLWGESNGHVGIWTNFLKKMALNTFQLKHTEAPMIAAGEMGKIANILILKKLYNTAVYGVNKDLESLGVLLVRTNQFFAAIIAGRCISSIVNQLFTFLFLCSKGEYQNRIYIKSISESISTIVRNAKEVKSNPNNYDAIVEPLVSTLWPGHISPNIQQLTTQVLSLKYKDEKSEIEMIRLLTLVFENLGWVARHTYQIKTVHAGGWMAQSFSESVYHVLSHLFENRKVEQSKQDVIKNLLIKIVKSISNALNFAFGNEDINNELSNFSAIPVLIIYFAKFKELPQLIEAYKIPIDRLIWAYRNVKNGKDPYGYTRKEIRSYIQLYGSWLHLCFPSSELSKSTIEFLKENRIKEEIYEGILESIVPELEQLGYPQGELLSEVWVLYPSEHWHQIQYEVNQKLNNHENYRSYSKVVNSLVNNSKASR